MDLQNGYTYYIGLVLILFAFHYDYILYQHLYNLNFELHYSLNLMMDQKLCKSFFRHHIWYK